MTVLIPDCQFTEANIEQYNYTWKKVLIVNNKKF